MGKYVSDKKLQTISQSWWANKKARAVTQELLQLRGVAREAELVVAKTPHFDRLRGLLDGWQGRHTPTAVDPTPTQTPTAADPASVLSLNKQMVDELQAIKLVCVEVNRKGNEALARGKCQGSAGGVVRQHPGSYPDLVFFAGLPTFILA